MKSEDIKYPEVNGIFRELLMTASRARRFKLKYDLIDRIISLFTSDKDQSNDTKYENLILLQEKITLIKCELGKKEIDVLMWEVVDTISEYLIKNSVFKEESIKNVKLLSDMYNEKVETLEHSFCMEDE